MVLQKVARGFLIFAPTAWVMALAGATATAAQGRASGVGSAATTLVYAIASVICHQRPERSFYWRGAQVPVCGRCLGIYLGAALVALWRMRRHGSVLPQAWIDPARQRLLFLVSATPALSTLAWEWGRGEIPSNLVRAASGLPLGAAVAWLLFGALQAGSSRPSVEVD